MFLVQLSKKTFYFNVFQFGILIQLFFCSSCKEDELPGYNQAINPIWEYNYKVGLSGSINPIIHKDKVLFSSSKELAPDLSANDKLIALDKSTGKLLWEWSDVFWDKYEHFDHLSSKPIFDNIIAFAIGSRNYAINLLNGETVWRNQTVPSMSQMSQKENKIYRVDIYEVGDIGIYCEQVLEADIHTGNWQMIFEVKGGDSLRQGLTVPTFYKDSQGSDIMIMANSVVNRILNATKGYVTPYLISYNKTKNEINYEVQLDEPGLTSRVDWYPIIHSDKVYLLVASLIVCRDLHTGELIWKRRFDGDFLFSGAIIENGYIYANRDGYDPTLYCIDVETGRIIWEVPSAGTSSPLQYHKGVLYFAGGSTGLLHIVNASTGQHIHKIKAPSQFKNNDDFFSRKCTVDKETNRVYVTSQTTAYCYPAVLL